MKITLVALALCFLVAHAVAQDKKYTYCDLLPDYKLISGKLVMYIDFGDKKEVTEKKGSSQKNLNQIVDETGDPIEFVSAIEAINYMAARGWELVQVYSVQASGIVAVHYIMRKPVEEPK